jgi:hypothetical protein
VQWEFSHGCAKLVIFTPCSLLFVWIGAGIAVFAILLGIATFVLYRYIKFHGKSGVFSRLFWSTEKSYGEYDARL